MRAAQSLVVAAVMTAALARADAPKDTIADLKALVAQQAYKEAYVHLADIAPSQRNADWIDVGGEACAGLLGTVDASDGTTLALIDQIDRNFPPLLKSAKYTKARADLTQLGEKISDLDIDQQMPNADAGGKSEYAQACESYQAAEEHFKRQKDDYEFAKAQKAIAEQTVADGAAGQHGGERQDRRDLPGGEDVHRLHAGPVGGQVERQPGQQDRVDEVEAPPGGRHRRPDHPGRRERDAGQVHDRERHRQGGAGRRGAEHVRAE